MSKSVSNKLKTSLQNLKLFYDHSPDMYVSVSPENAQVLYCNQTLLEKLNYTKKEIINHSVFKLYHPDSCDKAREVFSEFMNAGEIKNKEMVIISKDGKKLNVSLNVKAVKDENDQILFSISSLRDISDIVNTKSVLELKIKELDCIRRLNTLQSYRQLSEEDFLRQTVMAINDSWLSNKDSGLKISYQGRTYELGTTKKTNVVLTQEIIIRDIKSGRISFYLGESAKQLTDHHNNVLGDIRNIIVETLTNKQNDNLMMIMDSAIKSSTDCIAISDPDGKNIYQNNALEKMLGYTFEEMKEKDPLTLYADKDLALELYNTIKNGHSWKGETELIHKNGRYIPVFIRADAIKNQKNEIIGLFGIHTDISEERQREAEEKKRQKQALKIFDAIDEFVYVSDPNTFELLFTNKSLNKEIGKGKSLTGRLCYEALQGKNEACDFCTNIKLFREENLEPIIWEFQNLINKRWYRCTDKKIKWFDGKEVRMEIASDITEVKEANLKLIESEERYKLATTASNNGIWDWWVKENKVYYSDKWKAQLGYQPHELENTFENWEKNLHPEDFERMLNAVRNFLQNPKDYFIEEFRLKHKNGTYRWINNNAAAVLNEKGEVVRMFGAHTDITDKKLAEEALRKTDQLYRNLIQNAPDGIVVVDYQGNFRFASPSSLRMFGYGNEEIMKFHANDLMHPDDLDLVSGTFENLIESEKNEAPTIEYRFLHKTKGWIWIESTFSKTTDENEKPAIVINFRDISERKDYEEKLIKAMKKAETANIHKNQFLANMSHEIRTPMNGVIGFADLLKNDDLDTKSKNKFLQIIDNNAKQLLTLIDDIIDIAKIEAEEIKISKSSFEINEFLEELKNLFARIKSAKLNKDVDLILEVPETGNQIEIFTDQTRLRQILSNLLGNALKFTDNGFIKFGYNIHKGFIHFYVEDTGRGISKDKIDTIFERFQQSNFEDATIHGGTGLGLAICKGLVEILGGQITVQSVVGKGSKFHFSIPADVNFTTNKSRDEFDIKKAHSWLKNKTILLAEDDPGIQFYYETVLEPYQTNLIIASNGQEAIDLYRKHPEIDLVLMDIRMPEVNGYKATSQILKTNPNAVIIAQTAYVMPDEKDKYLKAGCKDYLTKPIKKDKLVKTILEYI